MGTPHGASEDASEGTGRGERTSADRRPGEAVGVSGLVEELETGDVLLLEHVTSGYRLELVVDRRGKSGFLLATSRRPYHRMCATKTTPAAISWKVTSGCPQAMWSIEDHSQVEQLGPTGGGLRHGQIHIHPQTYPFSKFLSMNPQGQLTLVPTEDARASERAVALPAVATWRVLRRAPTVEQALASEAALIRHWYDGDGERASPLLTDARHADGTGPADAAAKPPAVDTQAAAVGTHVPPPPLPSPSPSPLRPTTEPPPGGHSSLLPAPSTPPLLTSAERMQRDGFVLIPGLVSLDKARKAERVINHHLGSDRDWDVTGLGAEFLPQVPGEQLAGDAVVKLGHGSLCLHPTLLNLVGPEERQVISQEVLEGRAISDKFGCQVALRFPMPPMEDAMDGPAALPSLLRHATWHTDLGKYNDSKRFDFVVGIFLTRVQGPCAGGLWVIPGSHTIPLVPGEGGQGKMRDSTQFDATKAIPILAEPGTAIVFHKALFHAGGPNLSSEVRNACYYRLKLL